jgi:hypothetical protein
MALGEYNSGDKLKDGQIRISPSQVSQLSDNEWKFYQRAVLGENDFTGNTATRLGTVTHYYAEAILKGIEAPNDSEVIDYLESQNEADMWRVCDDSKAMAKAFEDNYKNDLSNNVESEKWFQYEPNDKIMLSGTADIVDLKTNTIWDIKTTSKLKSSIGDYWLQLYTLAYIARQNDCEVDNVGIIYLIAPTKTMGARYAAVKEPIDEDRLAKFIKWLQVKAKKIIYARDNDMAEILLSENLLSFRV